jgi:hypothetical protein
MGIFLFVVVVTVPAALKLFLAGKVTRKPNIVGPSPHRFRAQEHGVSP